MTEVGDFPLALKRGLVPSETSEVDRLRPSTLAQGFRAHAEPTGARVIVTCTECDTQFRLDDSKVSVTGLNVRCSVCKHAFFVPAPGGEVEGEMSDPAAAVHRIASAAIDATFFDEPGPTPEVSRDLSAPESEPSIDAEDEIATTVSPNLSPNSKGASGSDPESDWEFSHDPDSEADFGSVDAAEEEPATHVSVAAERAVDDLLSPGPAPAIATEDDSLGDPEDWDFFGDEGGDLSEALIAPPQEAASGQIEPSTDASAFAEVSDEAPQSVDGVVSPEPFRSDLSTGIEVSSDVQATIAEDDVVGSVSFALRRAGNAIGWVSVIALFTFGLHAGVNIQREAPEHPAMQRVAGTIIDSVEGRWIENILAGPLYVVSGKLRNAGDVVPAPGSVLALRLYGGSGHPLDSASAMVGPALTERQIREGDPDELIARLELGAARMSREPLASGEMRRFHAILREVPTAAVSFRLESAPLSLEVP